MRALVIYRISSTGPSAWKFLIKYEIQLSMGPWESSKQPWQDIKPSKRTVYPFYTRITLGGTTTELENFLVFLLVSQEKTWQHLMGKNFNHEQFCSNSLGLFAARFRVGGGAIVNAAALWSSMWQTSTWTQNPWCAALLRLGENWQDPTWHANFRNWEETLKWIFGLWQMREVTN